MNLEPLTEYTITVTCVNAAGPGNTSTPMMIETARKECVDIHSQYRSTVIPHAISELID